MKVVFFKPKMPEGQFNSMKSSYGITTTPGIEAGFYMDLSARSIDAVESMKKYFFRSRVYVITIFFNLKIWILAINDLHQVQRVHLQETNSEEPQLGVSHQG